MAGILNKVSAIVFRKKVYMDFDMVYEVYSNNALYSVAATVGIVCGVVWIGKQFVIGLLKVIKLMKNMDKDVE